MDSHESPVQHKTRTAREKGAAEKAQTITPMLTIALAVGRGTHVFNIVESAKDHHELRAAVNRIVRAIYSLAQDDPFDETSTIEASATVTHRGITFGGVTYWNDALLPLAMEKATVQLRFNFARPTQLEAYHDGNLLCVLDPVPWSSQAASEEGL